MHRISDDRFGGLAGKNFRMFRELCGEQTLRNVILMTSMWERVTPQQGSDRERQLKDKHFKAAIDKGAKLCRHTNTPESARAILRMVLKNRPAVLKIQHELVNNRKDIGQTGAGGELSRGISGAIVKYQSDIKELEEDMRKADEEGDKETQEELKDEKMRLEDEMGELRKAFENMKRDFEEAQCEMEKRINGKFKERLRRIREEHEEEIRRYEKLVRELEDAQRNASRTPRGWKCVIM